MINQIAILGSTGSIGKSLLRIIQKDKKKFKIILLTAKSNYKELFKQAKIYNCKNLIITDKKSFEIAKKINLKKKINLYNNFDNLKKIFTNKIDYVMSAISGINGLLPTFQSIKHTKKIAVANKESIICAWSIINRELKKNKTEFIPVDSEHFSIWTVLNNQKTTNNVDEILITASGGPFYKLPISKFSKIRIKDAIKHPNWKMGKKISVDSSTMMNKVFEIIEAKNIFDLPIRKLKILTHPQSYLHAIIKFKNGLTNMVIHETDMKIPIFNSIYFPYAKKINTKDINYKVLNNLSLSKPSYKKFPSLKLIDFVGNKTSLYETILISANDCLVDLFIKKKIKFTEIVENLNKILNFKEFKAYKYQKPSNVQQILNLSEQVRLKTIKLCIK